MHSREINQLINKYTGFGEGLKYSQSWDAQIPAWAKIIRLVRDRVQAQNETDKSTDNLIARNKWYISMCDKFDNATGNDDKLAAYQVLHTLTVWLDSPDNQV